MWAEIGLLVLPNLLVGCTNSTLPAPSAQLDQPRSSAYAHRLRVRCLLPRLCQGFIAGQVTRRNLPWSTRLRKPPLNPPNLVFPIVWPTLYVLMAIASYRVYTAHRRKAGAVHGALALYFVQLFFNFCWSFIYFHFHSLLGAMLDCYLLTALIALTMRQFSKIDAVAGWLLAPYLVWSCYAAYLATGIYFLNRGESGRTSGVVSKTGS